MRGVPYPSQIHKTKDILRRRRPRPASVDGVSGSPHHSLINLGALGSSVHTIVKRLALRLRDTIRNAAIAPKPDKEAKYAEEKKGGPGAPTVLDSWPARGGERLA